MEFIEFPYLLSKKIINLNFKYINLILKYEIIWKNLMNEDIKKIINKLEKIYYKEWINTYIDTNYDDY